MKTPDYKLILDKVAEIVSDGLYIVDANGESILYNEVMAKLEKTKSKDVLGKHMREVLPYLPEEESTLNNALKYKKSTINLQQTFVNQYGKEATTINTTVPVVTANGKVIAAIEVARDVTGIKQLSHTILDLQSEPKAIASKIKAYNFDNIIGHNENFLHVLDRAKRAAKNSATVLIYGETGTGKELFAQSIHFHSDRKYKPFLAQNCAALPESLLEGILFGTVKGAFTGAIDREGLFEQANGGTLLLDEISAMPYDLQSKLLRVLQENYVRRVGGAKDIPVDVRIIATINEDAQDLIHTGRLRQDLYYRLKIITINIPPLRERKDDIALLAHSFLEKYNKKMDKNLQNLSEKALIELSRYDYPGNVRELENIVLSAVSLCDQERTLTHEHLELPTGSVTPRNVSTPFDRQEQGLDRYLESIEKSILMEAMQSNGNVVSKAAKQLGIKRQTLQYKLKKYGIEA